VDPWLYFTVKYRETEMAIEGSCDFCKFLKSGFLVRKSEHVESISISSATLF